MREYNMAVKEALTKGLRRFKEQAFTAEAIQKLEGMRPSEFGLLRLIEAEPLIAGQDIIWPFPQVFDGKGLMLVADDTLLYTVDTSDWTLGDFIITYDAFSPSAQKGIVAGGCWHFADFFNTWLLTNGTSFVFHRNKEALLGGTNKTYVQTTKPVNSICAFRGRLVMGGFSPQAFWGTGWDTMVETDVERYQSAIQAAINMPSNFVYWSGIGGGDMLSWLFPSEALEGVVDLEVPPKVEPMWFDQMRRGDWGFMPMPWNGTVLCVKPIGNSVAVYGDRGIAVMKPVVEPEPTFGLVELSSQIGILGRGAVGGDGTHVFVGSDRNLYTLTADLQLKRLGYYEYLQDMTSQCVIFYDTQEEEYYISDGALSYVFNKWGLAACGRCYTSGLRNSNRLKAVFDEAQTLDHFEFTSNSFDMGTRSLKQVSMLEIGSIGLLNVEAQLWARRHNGSWYCTPWATAGPDNFVSPGGFGITGTEFQIMLRGTLQEDARLEYLNIRYKMVDLRHVRGIQPQAE